MGIILNIMGNFLSTAQKYNRYNFEHNRLGTIFRQGNDLPSCDARYSVVCS